MLNIVVGALSGLFALFALLFFSMDVMAAYVSTYVPISTGVVIFLLIIVLLLMVPCIITGVALLNFKPWARTAGTVLSIIEMVNFPLGTIVGVYGLWVLMSSDADYYFEPRFKEYVGGRR